jgi:hypothetical protein
MKECSLAGMIFNFRVSIHLYKNFNQMNKTFIIVLSVAASLLMVQCKKKKEVIKETVQNTISEGTQPSELKNTLQPIVGDRDYKWPGSTDPFTMLSQRVSGDTLFLQVQYGGGCKDHVFTMNTQLMWMKSLPPQLNLWLEHESNDDMCRALLTKELTFDLKGVRSPTGNKVSLIINNDREKTVAYTW